VTRERIASFRNPWFTVSVGITAAIALVAAVVGFVWLPLAHPGEGFKGVWDAICSAAGLVRNAPSRAQIVRADYLTTSVAIDPQMLQSASAESIGRGATLALRCTTCHGARGLSQADTPNLAGQYPVTIYKDILRLSAARLGSPACRRRTAAHRRQRGTVARHRPMWSLPR